MMGSDPRSVDGTGDPPARPRAALASLQVMRGAAAVAVVLYHTHLILSQPVYGRIDRFGELLGKGWIGVNFFFVLSGFIIPYAHHADIGRPERAWRYVGRRFTRVYPIYWLFLTLYIAAAAIGVGHPDFKWTVGNLSSAYALTTFEKFVPAPTLPLKVAWTLFYEVLFYAAFLLLMLNRRVGTIVLAAWVAVIFLLGPVLNQAAPPWPLHTWNLYFVAGSLGFLLFRRWEGRDGGGWLLVAGLVTLILIGAAGLIGNHIALAQVMPRRLLLMALPFTMILVGAALADRRSNWRPPAALALLGEASYAVYLVHSSVISLLASVNHHFASRIAVPAILLYAGVAVIATVAGVIAHLVIERPLLRALRRRPEPAPRPIEVIS